MFKQHLLSVVSEGLADLTQAQALGKVPKNGPSESHFFSVWVGQAIKNKRFDIAVIDILKTWQQQARTLGAGADLKNTFIRLQQTYQGLSDNGEGELSRTDLDALLALLETSQWQVTSDTVIIKKMSIKSHGVSSFVVAPSVLANGFDLKSRVVCYVRGEQQQFIDLCYQLGILTFKVTDYKSPVKFHGEFMLEKQNNCRVLPEIPSQYC